MDDEQHAFSLILPRSAREGDHAQHVEGAHFVGNGISHRAGAAA
jgi:hypothetical protein